MNRKKTFRLIALIIILAPILYLLIEVARTKVLYEETEKVPIEIDKQYHEKQVQFFCPSGLIVKNSFLIENNDTLITYESKDQPGITWILSGYNELSIDDLEILPRDIIAELENGTYKNYTIGSKFPIRISYKHGRKEHKLKSIVISLNKDSYIEYLEGALGESKILHIKTNDVVEIRRPNMALMYRIEYAQLSDIYISKRGPSIYFSIIQ